MLRPQNNLKSRVWPQNDLKWLCFTPKQEISDKINALFIKTQSTRLSARPSRASITPVSVQVMEIAMETTTRQRTSWKTSEEVISRKTLTVKVEFQLCKENQFETN